MNYIWGFFTQKVFHNLFSKSTKRLTEITRKRKWLMKNRKIPSFFFFLFNQMLYLKVKAWRKLDMLNNWLLNVQSSLYIQWLISFKTAVSSVDTVSTSIVMNSGTYWKLALEEHITCLRNEIFQWITSVLSKVQKTDCKVQTIKTV